MLIDSALAGLYHSWWKAVRLRYYEAALAHLTRVDPCHPDIPEIVHKLNNIRSTP